MIDFLTFKAFLSLLVKPHIPNIYPHEGLEGNTAAENCEIE
jgi:hypothetical protein